MTEVSNGDSEPYLSVIFSGRNDNYGGDFNTRLQLSIDWYAYWFEKYKLSAELLIVNYNPVPDTPGLDQMLKWPENRQYLQIRMLTVPPEIHEQYIDENIRKTVPLFEFIAKNLAIPRAKGRYIVCTNADILFAPDLIRFLAQKTLKPGILYRCDRYDFRLEPDDKLPIPTAQLETFEERLKKSVFKFFISGGTYQMTLPKNLVFRKIIMNLYHRLRVFYYSKFIWIPGVSYFRFLPLIPPQQKFFFKYHCNAAGDFALMSREDWMDIKGYLEDTWISTHTDSLQVLSAVTAGKKIEIIPHPCYHQHHERRYDFDKVNPDMELMLKRLFKSYETMERTGEPILNPDDKWYLPGKKFEEAAL